MRIHNPCKGCLYEASDTSKTTNRCLVCCNYDTDNDVNMYVNLFDVQEQMEIQNKYVVRRYANE